MEEGMIRIRYVEWDEAADREVRVDSSWEMARHYLFVCKLVNATILGRSVWEHLSHETAADGRSTVYMRPWRPESLPLFGAAAGEAMYREYDTADGLRLDYWVWRNGTFERAKREFAAAPSEAGLILLDHYITVEGRSREVVFTAFDMERNVVFLFLDDGEEEL